jgi:quinol monooxygenase YgiN
MFVSIVKARVRPQKVAIYEATFKELRALVQANEPGVLFYELCRDPKVPYSYRVVEAYTDQATQNAHLEMDYYKARIPIIMDCLEGGTYELEVLEAI